MRAPSPALVALADRFARVNPAAALPVGYKVYDRDSRREREASAYEVGVWWEARRALGKPTSGLQDPPALPHRPGRSPWEAQAAVALAYSAVQVVNLPDGTRGFRAERDGAPRLGPVLISAERAADWFDARGAVGLPAHGLWARPSPRAARPIPTDRGAHRSPEPLSWERLPHLELTEAEQAEVAGREALVSAVPYAELEEPVLYRSPGGGWQVEEASVLAAWFAADTGRWRHVLDPRQTLGAGDIGRPSAAECARLRAARPER